jgi:hypothetical protein
LPDYSEAHPGIQARRKIYEFASFD